MTRIDAHAAWMAGLAALLALSAAKVLAQEPHQVARVSNKAAVKRSPGIAAKTAATSADKAAAPVDTVPKKPVFGAPKVITISREVFQYSPAGRRDPFVSLLKTSDVRPVLADLKLTGVAYDPRGGNSVVILRDLGTHEQYRGKVGGQVGRMRIVRIEPKSVTFAIEEFGFSRQESLTLGDTTSTRTP